MKYIKLYDGQILYHFCAGQFLDSIKKHGLRLGKIPWLSEPRGIKLISGYQWLTINPEFQQSWAQGSTLKYDRTEYRLTICLPKVELFNLHKWVEYGKDNPLFEELNAFGDPDNWYLFKGVIIPYWISAVDKKPMQV